LIKKILNGIHSRLDIVKKKIKELETSIKEFTLKYDSKLHFINSEKNNLERKKDFKI
jgi:hypothetical protein